MTDSEFRRRRQQLLDRFLSGEIDQSSYDRMLGQLEQLESDSSPRTAKPDTARGDREDQTAHMSLGDHDTVAPAASSLTPGVEIGGYRLIQQLGRGGMGEVWKARDTVGERDVVVKVLPPEMQNNQDEMDRVRDVFHRVHALQHQHICPIYQLGQDPRVGFYLVMKFVDGETLSRYRREYLRSHESFPLAEAIRVLLPTAAALDYAHSQKVVHRDVKPHNIMVGPQGNDPQLVDFGLAAEIRMSVTRISRVEMETSGTYPYMAPEQWKGEFQDGRTDQYALAVVAYELLSGQTPFHTPDALVLRQCVMSEQVPEIAGQPPHVNAALRKAMAKSRGERFESCTAFIDALREQATRPIPPPRPTTISTGELKSDIAIELKEATAALRQAGDLRSYLERMAGTRMAHWRQAAQQGLAGGQWLLGKCFEHGIGVDKSMPEAIDLYRQAARRGEPVAQTTLGNCYLRGRGVPQNSPEAVMWFRKAAKKNDAFAATALGRCYLHGEGVAANIKEALKQLNKAAQQGHPPAQVELGVVYAEGQHVPRDLDQARAWLKVAADQGNQKAQQWLDHLDSRQNAGEAVPEPTRLLADPGTVDAGDSLPRNDARTDVESEITRKDAILPTGVATVANATMPMGPQGLMGSAPTAVGSDSGSGPLWQSHPGTAAARNWVVPAIVASLAAILVVVLSLGGAFMLVKGLGPNNPSVTNPSGDNDDNPPGNADGTSGSTGTAGQSDQQDTTGPEDNGSQTEGSTDEGTTDQGSTDEGTTDNGSTDEGTTDEGTTDEGSTDNGSTDQGATDEGTTDEGTTDEGSQVVPPIVPGTLASARYRSLAYVLADSEILAGDDDSVSLWDGRTGEFQREFGQIPGGVADLAATPNTNFVVISGVDDPNARVTDGDEVFQHALWIWGIKDESARYKYDGHDHRTLCARFSQSSLKMISGDDAGGVIFWDTENAQELEFMDAPGTAVLCVELARRDFFGMTGHDDGTVRVWDLYEAKEVRRFEGHEGPVNGVAINWNRTVAISAGDDGQIIEWDFSPSGSFWLGFDGEDKLRELEGHTAAVTAVVITPDDKYAVSSSRDGTVRIWDIATGEELHRFETPSELSDVVVDQGQQRVAACGDKVYVWDLPAEFRGQQDTANQ